jgi:hypothetical protein
MQRWVERPEARWALWSGLAAALTLFVASSVMILADASATGAFGFIFVPLVAAVAAIPVAVWGAALGHVVLHLQGRAPEPKIVFWVALVAALSMPAVAAYELWSRFAPR